MSTSEIAADWTDPGDAFLVSGRNYDGSLRDSLALASEAHPFSGNTPPSQSYEAITDIDRDRDRQLFSADLNFAELKIWTKTSSNEASAYSEMLTLPDLGPSSLNLNATPAWTRDPVAATSLVSNFSVGEGRTRPLAPPTTMLTVAPTEMQIGVLDLVDAMAAFGNGLADKSPNFTNPATLQASTAAHVSSNTTSQLVQALSQFDANGNPVLGQADQHNTMAGLAANESGRQPDNNTAGLLAVGKG